jgi:alpha-methylacyl-CoA racemase
MDADVLRIERMSAPAVALGPQRRYDFPNRSKRSVILDLKQAAAVGAVKKLIVDVDIIIEGFRPGVMERLGLAPETCRAINPKLVYGRMTAGDRRARSSRKRATTSTISPSPAGCIRSESPIGRPRLRSIWSAISAGGALYLIVGVLAAAFAARETGKGQTVDAAMVDGIVHLMSLFQGLRQQGAWTEGRAENLIDGGASFYRCYAINDDKHVAVGAIEPQFYANLLRVMGLESSSLPDQNDRRAWAELRETFAERFRIRSRGEWAAAAAGRDACLSPVLTMDEAPAHPQLGSR